jgi:Rrf2 family iron-sulfur cluster assembly transcriptional regulator
MKFSALEEYGLRCILRVAKNDLQPMEQAPCGSDREELGGSEARAHSGTYLTIGEIAREEGLTEEYAGKIIRVLHKSKLVESVRGRRGGYRLSRPPESITIAETLAALGGKLFDAEVCGRYTAGYHECVHSTDCAIRSLWRELQEMIDRVLQRTTLRDLLTSSESGMRRRFQDMALEAIALAGAPSSALVTVGRFDEVSRAGGILSAPVDATTQERTLSSNR